MAIWAIGDIQGCMSSLEGLLARIVLAPGDRLWLVGDLVNRGPRSLDVLRWARGLGDTAVCVLGNHDLHLLARAAGVAEPKKRDTLDDVLHAPDRDELIDWLRHRPFAHVEDERILVHGGLNPVWGAKKVLAVAAELEAPLRGDDWREWLRDRPERARTILSYLVRARCLDKDGKPDSSFDDHPKLAPRGLTPWFDWKDAAWRDHTVVFGHWAMLGLSIGVRHIGLDSGCVWGRFLTAMRLDDGYVVQEPARER
jgi:bis(5'-nucleosyl)-tetraphosphatase (symmetrical)